MPLQDDLEGARLDLFPLRHVLRNYSFSKAGRDLRAAVNVALLDFPQAMAYALVAGLPVQMGIFSSALSSITGPFLASSRFVMLGPTNATAVMLLSVFLSLGYSPEEAVLVLPTLLVLVGVFLLIGAVVRIASITQYISRAVVVGYISAAACLIIVNQMKTVFGLEVERASTFVGALFLFFGALDGYSLVALGTAGITLVVYYSLQALLPKLPNVALSLLVASVAVYWLRPLGFEPEMLSGIDASAWPIGIPRLIWSDIDKIATGAMAIAFLSMLESSSIAKTLAARAGDHIDLNQQMLSMGVSNIVCAGGSGMTVSGSLTRSVLNYTSGAKTAVSSIFSGILLVSSLFFLGDFIGYVPRASLAALVIVAGLSLFNRDQIRFVIKTTRSDAMVFFATLGSGMVFSLDTAIYIGSAASLILFVRKAARPDLKEISFSETGELVDRSGTHKRPEIAIVHVEGDLFFASSDVFLEQMRRLTEHTSQRAIILRLRNAYHLDATAAMVIQELILFARTKDCHILVSGAHEGVEKVFRSSGLMAVLGEDNFFRHHPENPNLSTRDALKRAQDITQIKSSDITIFASS